MKNRKKEKLPNYRVDQLRWYIIFGICVVVASVMASGLAIMGYYMFHSTNEGVEIAMIGMIVPMALVMAGSIWAILHHINRQIQPLLNAIHEVSEGNLEIVLDEKYSGEYETLYRDFNKMSKELRATKEEMQAFINEFTHEFKTPITSISGFADYLYQMGDDISPEEREEYLKIISEQAHRLSNLSQNTLLLSKVEATQIITDKKKFSLSSQIQSCAILFLKKMEERDIALNIPEDIQIDYYGDEELMEQIWINLIGNALKFTPDHGEITISEIKAKDHIEIGISDNGIGMTEDTVSHIFEKYYQNDTTNIVKGNGIGLSIVKRIVDLCGGEIKVSSELNAGSTFTVILPVN